MKTILTIAAVVSGLLSGAALGVALTDWAAYCFCGETVSPVFKSEVRGCSVVMWMVVWGTVSALCVHLRADVPSQDKEDKR